jgi:hypothetical protein
MVLMVVMSSSWLMPARLADTQTIATAPRIR